MNTLTTVRRTAECRATDAYDLLLPAQKQAFDKLDILARATPMVSLTSPAGFGKTTVLRAFADRYDAEYLCLKDIFEVQPHRAFGAAEETALIVVDEALKRSDVVILDNAYPLFIRRERTLGSFQMSYLAKKVRELGKRLIFSGDAPGRISQVEIGVFDKSDYRMFFATYLGEDRIADIDFDLIYRHAEMLSGHDLKNLCGLLAGIPKPTTEDVKLALDDFIVGDNLKIEEVEELEFAELPGTEHISSKLETHIIVPLENVELARKLDIRAKRGVLLYGPPGTGKTSIGRALAHRMKGRFFLIDGSFITEPPVAFFAKVTSIVKEAKENAPCVLFIDDADVLFGIEHIAGFSRFLLSLLDGVESKSAGSVCLMMTAMNVAKIPAAILRSGRVELWLETRAPDASVRADILRRWLNPGFPEVDQEALLAVAEEGEGFTPADLRRIAADAMTLYAADRIANRSVGIGRTYLSRAIADLIATRQKMADNLEDESLRLGVPRKNAKYGMGIGGLVQASTSCITKDW